MTYWTNKQILRIRSGVIAGRIAMQKHGADTFIFSDAFIKAGGLQVPGWTGADETTLRRIGGYVMVNLIEQSGARAIPGEPDWFFAAVVREMNRALSEVYWYGAAQHPDAVGFRLMVPKNVAELEGCNRFAECDNYGLGAGIFPKEEIVVLPLCCDYAFFVAVFEDEI